MATAGWQNDTLIQALGGRMGGPGRLVGDAAQAGWFLMLMTRVVERTHPRGV